IYMEKASVLIKKFLMLVSVVFPIMNLASVEAQTELYGEAVMMKEKKILISGAGIAGFTLAYWLKQRGFSPTIIEKHPHVRGGGYKVDVRGTALEVAKRMGIYQDLLEANVNLVCSKFVSSNQRVFEFDGDILGYSSEGEIEINRWDLAQILSKKVGEIEVIYGDSITNIDGKMVHFEQMNPREFDIVVGADGQYSNVRRLAFGEDAVFLKRYGIQFCVFPIPNIFELERQEIVYFDKGKLATAYAIGNHSYACLAFKSEEQTLLADNLKAVFEKQFQGLDWEIPRLVSLMKESDECYFNSIAQVRMPYWSQGRVVLIGDAAHSVQAMGTSLAMVGAYVLAREIDESKGDYKLAFDKYEKNMRKFVEAAQDLAKENQQAFTESSLRMKIQLYLMEILPKKIIQYFTNRGKRQMKELANSLILEPIIEQDKQDDCR
ncbi:MAG: FAD-dependent monooxygenase, partial [Chlamydiales bacterium]|nr:FAD-dependent monooxygenase [Chlamydiales bacterium]